MCTRSKFAVLFFMAIMACQALQAQVHPVTVSIAVAPPYPPHVQDYIDQPNKIMATLTNTTTSTVYLYLQGAITGEGGIRVYTDPDYKMPNPLILTGGQMYFLTRSNLEQVFNADHLIYEGISENEIVYGNGLPEGEYQVCLQAFFYDTGDPASGSEPQGCSAPFVIMDIEPPVILQPLCEMVIKPTTPQQVVFSWTKPPNSPINTQYKLKVIEVLPSDRNINDAMKSAVHPVFFEKDVTVTNYLFGPADPALVSGKNYAFAVTAYDPAKKVVFRNGGMSEVCSFEYRPDTAGTGPPKYGRPVPPGNLGLFEQEFKRIEKTVISGQLFCKYPSDPDKEPGIFDNVTPKVTRDNIPANYFTGGQGTYSYPSVMQGAAALLGGPGSTSIGFGNPQVLNNNAPPEVNDYCGPILAKMQSKKFIFQDREAVVNVKPLAHQRVVLMARVALLNTEPFGTMPQEYGGSYAQARGLDMNGKYVGHAPLFLNIPLDVTETDSMGNYTFEFRSDFYTGPAIFGEFKQTIEETLPANRLEENQELFGGGGGMQVMGLHVNMLREGGYICLKVEVENQKFCSPDIDVFAMPGDVITLPAQVAKLKTYTLEVTVKSSKKENQQVEPGKPMEKVRVAIVRDTCLLDDESPLILSYEGQRLKAMGFLHGKTYKYVSKKETGSTGIAVFHNLVRNAYINPQYTISLATRDSLKGNNDYDYTFYNYKEIFCSLDSVEATKAIMKPWPKVDYNHEYPSPPLVSVTYVMEPLAPEIKGRVMAATNYENQGVRRIRVKLVNQKSNSASLQFGSLFTEVDTMTNEAGFFRFVNLPVNVSQPGNVIKGPFRRVEVKPPSYIGVMEPPAGQYPYNLRYGQLKDLGDINLQPAHLLLGEVVDEDGKPVPCYIKSQYSPYYKTVKAFQLSPPRWAQTFELPVEEQGTILTVEPLSSQYFKRDTTIRSPDLSQMLTVKVYKRLHRPVIVVKNKQGEPLQGALVMLAEQLKITDSKGEARFSFAAAGDQFVLRISGGTNYSPLLTSFKNVPTSRPVISEFVLENGKSISGKITDKGSSRPIGNARIFSQLMAADGTTLDIETYSADDGTYTLRGIPSNRNSLEVHISKAGEDPSYAGIVKTVNLNPVVKIGTTPSYNFALERIDGWKLASIWGFPVAIEKFTLLYSRPDQPQEATIDGYFYNPPRVSGFDLQQGNLKFPFKGLKVKKSADGTAIPQTETIPLELLEAAVKLENVFSGLLSNLGRTGTGFNLQAGGRNNAKYPLELSKSGLPAGTAAISGHVKMDLASFRISNQFQGDLFIGDTKNFGVAAVFANASIPGLTGKHYVFSLGSQNKPVAVKNYKVFNFPAEADLDSSWQQGGQFSLRSILHTQIPAGGGNAVLDLKLRAGDLVITGNEINFVNAAAELPNFSLEQWKVYGKKNWEFNKNEESFILPEVLIVTGMGIDATVKNMRIRYNSLSEGEISMNGGLSLGGIAKIQLSPGVTPLFNYDKGTGHYRISVVNPGDQPAGTVSGLPNTSPPDLVFNSIGILSNQQTNLTVKKGYKFYNIIDAYVDNIMSGKGFFKLNGQPDLHIPGYVPAGITVKYTRNGTNGPMESFVEPLVGSVTIPGNVEFVLDGDSPGQSVKKNEFAVYGTTYMMNGPGEKSTALSLRGHLVRSLNECNLEIIRVTGDSPKAYKGDQPQRLVIGAAPGNRLMVLGGGTGLATDSTWNTLVFRADCRLVPGLDNPKTPGEPNLMNFVVHGGIDIHSDKLEVTKIPTPFGNLKMTYLFNEQKMTGDIHISDMNLGVAKLEEGDLHIEFGRPGYYLSTAGSVNIGGTSGFEGGFIVGNYTGNLTQAAVSLLKGFAADRPDLTQGLKGFYAIGVRNFIDFSQSFPGLDFLSVEIRADLGLHMLVNFAGGTNIAVGGYGLASCRGGISVSGCEIGVRAYALGLVKGYFQGNNLTFEACSNTGIDINLCTYKASANLFVKGSCGTKGVSVDGGFGTCK